MSSTGMHYFENEIKSQSDDDPSHQYVSGSPVTCDRNKSTVFGGASFSDHAQCVEAFIVFEEVWKSQGGHSSASFNLHPFRIKQTRVCK